MNRLLRRITYGHVVGVAIGAAANAIGGWLTWWSVRGCR